MQYARQPFVHNCAAQLGRDKCRWLYSSRASNFPTVPTLLLSEQKNMWNKVRSTKIPFLHADKMIHCLLPFPNPFLNYVCHMLSSLITSSSCTLHIFIFGLSNFSDDRLQQISKKSWRRRKNPRMQLERELRRKQRPQVRILGFLDLVFLNLHAIRLMRRLNVSESKS